MTDTNRTYRRFLDRSEFESLDGFVGDTFATQGDFDFALGDYDLKAQLQCGLSSCHSWHNFGYVVTLKDGRITNVGGTCGEIFGEEFSAVRRQIESQREAEAIIKSLADFRGKVDEFERMVRDLNGGPLSAFGLRETLRQFRDTFPLYDPLYERARRSDLAIRITRRRSDIEVEALRASSQAISGDALLYEERVVARLAGLRVLLRDPADMIREKVIKPLAQLKVLPADSTMKERKRLNKCLGGMQDVLNEAHALERDAEAFFTPNNFEALRMLPAGSQAEALSEFQWDFSLQRPPDAKQGRRSQIRASKYERRGPN